MPEDLSIVTAEKAKTARVVGPYLQPLLQIVKAAGISPQELALAAGLPENSLAPIPQWLLASNYIRLLDTGAKLTQNPFFGLHVGAQVKLGTFNVYGLILLSCNDFGHALQQTMRYEGLAHDLGCSDLQVHGEIAEYQWHSYFPNASRHLTDSVFAGIAVFGSWLAGSTLPVREVGVRHAAPIDAPNYRDEYRRLLGIVPKFEQANNYGLFDAELLERPVPNADVSMYPVLQQHAEQLLLEKQRSQQDGGIIAQVRAIIVKNLAQDRVRLPMIAQDLHLTQRTLQRKLREANSSFQTVLDDTRHQLACNYLQQPNLNLAEIAFMLGFQEQSSFNHAFKEWQGINPGAYREQFARA